MRGPVTDKIVLFSKKVGYYVSVAACHEDEPCQGAGFATRLVNDDIDETESLVDIEHVSGNLTCRRTVFEAHIIGCGYLYVVEHDPADSILLVGSVGEETRAGSSTTTNTSTQGESRPCATGRGCNPQ